MFAPGTRVRVRPALMTMLPEIQAMWQRSPMLEQTGVVLQSYPTDVTLVQPDRGPTVWYLYTDHLQLENVGDSPVEN